jgi:hypothetical protein
MVRIIHYYTQEPYWYRGKSVGLCGLSGRRSQDKDKVTCKRCLQNLAKEGKQ